MHITIDEDKDINRFVQIMKGWRIVYQIQKVLTNKKSHQEQIRQIKELVK